MNSNIKNRTIFLGDNLDFLRGINSECVDLIYADPPFNKKKKFTAPIGSASEGADFLDLFAEEDIKDEWVDEFRQEHYELYSFLNGIKAIGNSYNYCYLVYMAIRLVECHRLLKKTGSLYLHCDSTMNWGLRAVLDCIFGDKNFRNEIVWGYAKPRPAKKMFVRNHDTIFFYAKSEATPFNPQRMPNLKGEFVMREPIHRADGTTWLPKERGVLAGSWWHDIASFATRMSAKERTGYPTQKPLKLLQRIIAASSESGDLVLDPFCGCATTCVAAEMSGRQWVGMDVSVRTWELINLRLNKEMPDGLVAGQATLNTEPPQRGTTDVRSKKHIYVISNPAFQGMCKVGVASNVDARLKSYQTADPQRAYQLEYKSKPTPEYKTLEPYIHRKFNGDHEWVAGDLDAIIAAIKNYTPTQTDALGFDA